MAAGPPGLGRAIKVSRRDWWSDGAYRAIQVLIKHGRPFTSEDVVAIVGEAHEPHLVGAVLAGAKRSGQIASVGAVVGRDGRPRRVWAATPKQVLIDA